MVIDLPPLIAPVVVLAMVVMTAFPLQTRFLWMARSLLSHHKDRDKDKG